MPHPLVLALFRDHATAARAVVALRSLGIDRGDLSVVARNHEAEGELARELGATPGAEIEDSRAAALLGELSGQVLAAIALVLPGIGPIVTAGPLSADLGEAAGHAAGGLESVMHGAGVSQPRARDWQKRVRAGAVLIGVHVRRGDPAGVSDALAREGADDVEMAEWRA